MNIVPDIETLLQHTNELKNNLAKYSPQVCPYCKHNNVWHHGYYARKVRDNSEVRKSKLILIPRFLCPKCKHTCASLPECVSPRRWYIWSAQQATLIKVLLGNSIRKISKSSVVARSTIRRWATWLKNKYLIHGSALCSYYQQLGTSIDYKDFWSACLHKISLSKAMLLSQKQGAIIP